MDYPAGDKIEYYDFLLSFCFHAFFAISTIQKAFWERDPFSSARFSGVVVVALVVTVILRLKSVLGNEDLQVLFSSF